MAHKIVNLDDEKNTASITIENKTFEIKRIVLKARQIYGEYLQAAGEYLVKISKFNERAQNTGDRQEISLIDNQLTESVEDWVQTKAGFIEGLMEVILTKNGYDWEPDWWYENTDYQMMERFIETALKKDEEPAQAGKKGGL